MKESIHLKRKVIAGSQEGPHLLITGGVHGDEFEAMGTIRRLIQTITPENLRGRLTLVPVVNEAAFWRGERTAEDNLDLARTCPGRPDGSITERTAHAVSELIRSADYFIDLHSGGNVMRVSPMSGYVLHRDAKVLDAQRRMAKAFNLPIVWGTSPDLDGRTLSVARDAGVPAMYTEWQGSGECDPAGVNAEYEGCLNVLGELGMMVREPPPSLIKHICEDHREQSGHMQVNYPAPMAGFFEPSVNLEQSVKSGEPLGIVTDFLGERTETILLTQTGIVLTLRAFSRVDKGDCLGVIIDSDEDR